MFRSESVLYLDSSIRIGLVTNYLVISLKCSELICIQYMFRVYVILPLYTIHVPSLSFTASFCGSVHRYFLKFICIRQNWHYNCETSRLWQYFTYSETIYNHTGLQLQVYLCNLYENSLRIVFLRLAISLKHLMDVRPNKTDILIY